MGQYRKLPLWPWLPCSGLFGAFWPKSIVCLCTRAGNCRSAPEDKWHYRQDDILHGPDHELSCLGAIVPWWMPLLYYTWLPHGRSKWGIHPGRNLGTGGLGRQAPSSTFALRGLMSYHWSVASLCNHWGILLKDFSCKGPPRITPMPRQHAST